MALLDDVKLYLRVDGTDEDPVIQGLVDAAKQFMKTGTGVVFDETDARQVLVLKLLVAYWYDHRSDAGSRDGLPFTIIAQLIQIEAEGQK